jgi:predicted transglutaminase-like protease
MSFKEKNEAKLKKNYENACRYGYCPSTAERKNERIQELANLLKADSEKEALTNIQEWQNKNISFWYERYPLAQAIWMPLPFLIFTALFLCNPIIKSVMLAYLSVIIIVCICISASSLLLSVDMVYSYRKLSLKQWNNIFPNSISVNTILENKLGVCRDYAKITSALLFNIYPEREVYFVHARSHVAVGFKIQGKTYVLDKYLPVTTIDRWHEKWNKAGYSNKKVEKAKGIFLESVPLQSLLTKTTASELNKKKLEEEMAKRLGIHRLTTKIQSRLTMTIFQWKKGAILYEDDEVVNSSLEKRFKAVLSETLNINRIADIKIGKKKKDLIFQIEIKD